MFWKLWLFALFVLFAAGLLRWWVWLLWTFVPIFKLLVQDWQPETEEQGDHIRAICIERGISRREAVTDALGRYRRNLSTVEANKVIDWLLDN